MKLLDALPPIPQFNSPEVQALYPPVTKFHAGKMRYSLASFFLAWAVPPELRAQTWIADPFVGVGTTLLAANELGFAGVYGQDVDPRCQNAWGHLSAQGRFFELGDSRYTRPRAATGCGLLFTSPNFPTAHDPGAALAQAWLRAKKGLNAGHALPNQTDWKARPDFTLNLRRVLHTWRPALLPSALVAVHIREHVAGGVVVAVRDWVADALRGARLDVLGVVTAPLSYKTFYQALVGRPRQRVTERMDVGDGTRIDTLACGHQLIRTANYSRREKACCPECQSTAPDRPLEEVIVVGEVPLL